MRPELRATDTFAAHVLRTHADRPLVDACCGSCPHLALRWLALGHTAPVTFVDWGPAVESHRAASRVEARALGVRVPASWRWRRDHVQRCRLDGDRLVVHLTLPRWSGAPGVIKPRGTTHGVRLLEDLARTRASGLSAHLSAVEAETLLAGAVALGWDASHRDDLRSACFEPNTGATTIDITFPSP